MSLICKQQDIICKECSSDDTVVEAQRFKNGKVNFRVECNKCGSFSHYFKRTRFNEIVEELDNKEVNINSDNDFSIAMTRGKVLIITDTVQINIKNKQVAKELITIMKSIMKS